MAGPKRLMVICDKGEEVIDADFWPSSMNGV